MEQRLFPADVPDLEWVEFEAAGFRRPVSGVIYPADRPATNGMPLGGIDTGCIDLETNGLVGYLSIFNSLAPRRGPMNVPLMGLQVSGRTYVLAAHGMPAVEPAQRIQYWGHYPIADVEFDIDSPVAVGFRAWSPFVPGDAEASMIPGAVFEVHLRNRTDDLLDGRVAVSFPGFERYEVMYKPIERERMEGAFGGGIATAGRPDEGEERDPGAMSYALGVLDGLPFHLGYHFGWDADAWRTMGAGVDPMSIDHDNSGLSVTVPFTVNGGESRVVRFVLAWYAPVWSGNGTRPAAGNAYVHMYARRFGSVREVTEYLAHQHEVLLQRVLAWQEVMYDEEKLPTWLRDSLINILHLIPETSVWAQAKPPIGEWCHEEDGLFGLNECPRSCPQIECLPCSFYGNLPIVYFFPEAAQSTLRGYRAYQYDDGRPAWVFGGFTATRDGFYEMAQPHRGYQQALNGCCVVEMVSKLWLRTGDDDVLHEFYDVCKQATIYTMSLRPDYGDKQVISMPAGNKGTEWFEAPEPGWAGMATHVGGIRLAHLLIMRRMAERIGDEAFAARCQRWFDAGALALEEYLWAGVYYLNFYEPETGKMSDLVFGYQLDGHWMSRFHAAGDAFPVERALAVLATIKRCNIALSKSGAVNYAHADGSPAPVGGYGTFSYFPPELLMLAMTYMYHGQKEFGLELARRCWENIVCKQRLRWDQPNFFRGDIDTGERTFGNDYYQNMMLWSLVAALDGGDLSEPCKPGGLVDRVIKAGARARFS
jgi:uncharacterized protein (DUF608 family)